MIPLNKTIGRVENVNIGRVINSGRYGTVYHATGKRHGVAKEFAVKILPMSRQDMTEGHNLETVRNEIINMWRCRGHSNVVHLYDVYRDDANCYLLQEYCGGDTLQSKLGQMKSDGTVFNVIKDIASGLTHIHEKGLIFLDFKPQNIIYSVQDSTFKLTDFGSSRRFHNGYVHHTDVMCTPLFASPEVINLSGEITPMHDAWSLGIIMFWLLTGRHPFLEFDTRSPHQLLDAITTLPAPLHEVPSEYRTLVARLLEKDPTKRLQVKQVLHILQ